MFDESGFAILDEDESPDFALATRFGIRVGVEVTELYRSQSDARVTRIPGYFDELISGPRFRHRDDVAAIRVVDIEIQSPAGDGTYVPEQKVKGIVWDHPSPAEYTGHLVRAIEAKEAKCYRDGTEFVHLVIEDHIGAVALTPAEHFQSLVFTPELKRVLRQSRFGEIYLLTSLGRPGMGPGAKTDADPNESRVESEERIVPLRMLYLWSEAYFHNGARVEFRTSRPEISSGLLPSYAEYLYRTGGIVHVAPTPREGWQTILGKNGFAVHRDGKISIYDHGPSGLPPDAQLLALSDDLSPLAQEFFGHIEDYTRRYQWTGNISFLAQPREAPDQPSNSAIDTAQSTDKAKAHNRFGSSTDGN